jgi:hypothetical protein
MVSPDDCLNRPADDVKILSALEAFIDAQLGMRFRAPEDTVEIKMPQETLPAHEQALLARYAPAWEVQPFQRSGWTCFQFRRRR